MIGCLCLLGSCISMEQALACFSEGEAIASSRTNLQTSPHPPKTTQDMLYQPAKPVLSVSSSNNGCCRAHLHCAILRRSLHFCLLGSRVLN